MGADIECDIAIVGGGLAGGLTAYALSVKRPDLSVRLIDPSATFGGNHVWSFFTSDIAAEDWWIVEPFIDHQWDRYETRFPAHTRRFESPYNSIRSQNYDGHLRGKLPATVPVQGEAVELSQTSVYLADQRKIAAKGVFDGRGVADLDHLDFGWQKFVGQEYRTATPHGLTHPVVMDATVDQIDGYRFVYVLPFAEDRIFIEDTYYSDGPDIDREAMIGRISDYAATQGWVLAELIHQEIGALPVTMGGDFDAYWHSGGEAAKIGVRAALFHGTTGFSLPDAVRTASLIAELDDLSGPAIADAMHDFAKTRWEQGGFYRLLDRMLFRAATPGTRYQVLQRFYGLNPSLIQRFYAGNTTWFDKARILSGKPPVPIARAMAVMRERKR
jgi:lycopene beta-cyclase